jgi:phthiocerol/phenolphthiocerol synthesis type-I polyketide synthase D
MAVRIRNTTAADFGVEPPVTLLLQGASLHDLVDDVMLQLGLGSQDKPEATDGIRDRAQQRAAARHEAAARPQRGQPV